MFQQIPVSIPANTGSEFSENTKSWAELEASSTFSRVNKGLLLPPPEIGFYRSQAQT